MCGPDTPVVDGHPAACSAGSRRRRWSRRSRICSTRAGWRHDDGRMAAGVTARRAAADVQRRRGARAADVHVASGLPRWREEPDETVALAVAFAVRALRGGSVCVDLRSVAPQVDVAELPWPDADDWLAAVQASPLVRHAAGAATATATCCTWTGTGARSSRCADDLLAMLAATPPTQRVARPRPAVPRRATTSSARPPKSRCRRRLTVLTGGPGTGKTTTVARLLALLAEQPSSGGRGCGSRWRRRPARRRPGCRRRCSWRSTSSTPADQRAADRAAGDDAAPAARLPAGHVGAVPARPRQPAAARRDRRRRDVDGVADHDGPAARGGAAGRPADPGRRPRPAGVGGGRRGAGRPGRRARRARRRPDRRAEDLAPVRRVDRRAGRRRSATATPTASSRCCAAGGEHIEWVDTDDPAERLREVLVAARAAAARRPPMLGDAAAALATLDEHRLLCAHRRGPYGVRHWNRQVERWLAEATGEPIWSDVVRRAAAAGDRQRLRARPLQRRHRRDGARRRRRCGRSIAGAGEPLDFATSRLRDVETMHAMTIHKSQGSQADEVTVLLPPEDSRLLTRELFYTAVTRAKTQGARGRLRGRGARRDRAAGGAGDRAGAASARAHLISRASPYAHDLATLTLVELSAQAGSRWPRPPPPPKAPAFTGQTR